MNQEKGLAEKHLEIYSKHMSMFYLKTTLKVVSLILGFAILMFIAANR